MLTQAVVAERDAANRSLLACQTTCAVLQKEARCVFAFVLSKPHFNMQGDKILVGAVLRPRMQRVPSSFNLMRLQQEHATCKAPPQQLYRRQQQSEYMQGDACALTISQSWLHYASITMDALLN